jgi:hypothetical protein
MKTLTLKTTGNEFWDVVAQRANGEVGVVNDEPFNETEQFYNAIFPTYGGVIWIPSECCDVVETPDPIL